LTATVPHPDLQYLYELWLAKRGHRLMPSRTDLDPVEIPGRLWPHLMIVGVERNGAALRYRYRRVGGAFAAAFGSDPTGRYFDEMLPARGGYREYVLGLYDRIVTERRPFYSENTFALAGQSSPRLTRRLSLPLSPDGETVDAILTAHFFERPRSDRQPIDRESFSAAHEIALD
jgi:hypothetical protein